MESGSCTVLHVSDFQCGKPFVPRAAEALVRLAHAVRPEVVVASGDLTQRAKVGEFEQARGLLDRLGDAPIVLTPGNHDVPLYRLWERVVSPHRNWRDFAGPDLNTVTRIDGAVFVTLDSSAPHRTLVSGRIDPDQVDFARVAFERTKPGAYRVLVAHHHLVPIPGGEGGSPLPNAASLMTAFEEMGVDLVLGGHVHQMHVRTSADVPGARVARAIPIVAAGTTTSRRGRGVERGWNSLNVVKLDSEAIEVTSYRLGPEDDDFRAETPLRFKHAVQSDSGATPEVVS
jgi:3',5'-cyclic AMP phosphodiesterase CpdA